MERKHNTKLTTNARTLRKNMTKEEKRLWYDFLKSYPDHIWYNIFFRGELNENYVL